MTDVLLRTTAVDRVKGVGQLYKLGAGGTRNSRGGWQSEEGYNLRGQRTGYTGTQESHPPLEIKPCGHLDDPKRLSGLENNYNRRMDGERIGGERTQGARKQVLTGGNGDKNRQKHLNLLNKWPKLTRFPRQGPKV